MSAYTDTLAAFASATEAAVLALHDRYEAGEITEAQFIALATAALVRAGAQGAALADLALAATLSAQRQEPVPVLGLGPSPGAEGRARAAVVGMLGSEGYLTDPAAAVGVLARSEALAPAQDAYSRAMPRQGVRAWTRSLSAGACKLCSALAGAILPASTPMYYHKGCGCSQQPID